MIKNKKILILSIFVGTIFLIALLGPYFAPFDPNFSDASNGLKPPNNVNVFGTDLYGRDIFSRVLVASRLSITSSFFIVIFSGLFGTFFGMISGYFGGLLDQILMAICDMFLSFPQMIIAIGVAGVLGGGLENSIIALSVSNWMLYARLARSATLREKTESYVIAAKFSGMSDLQIIFKEIFINIKEIIIVTMMLNFGTMLIGLAGLSFLGIGVQVPQAEWGSMINEGRLYLSNAPWISFFPSLAVFVVVYVFNLLGNYLKDYYDIEK